MRGRKVRSSLSPPRKLISSMFKASFPTTFFGVLRPPLLLLPSELRNFSISMINLQRSKCLCTKVISVESLDLTILIHLNHPLPSSLAQFSRLCRGTPNSIYGAIVRDKTQTGSGIFCHSLYICFLKIPCITCKVSSCEEVNWVCAVAQMISFLV